MTISTNKKRSNTKDNMLPFSISDSSYICSPLWYYSRPYLQHFKAEFVPKENVTMYCLGCPPRFVQIVYFWRWKKRIGTKENSFCLLSRILVAPIPVTFWILQHIHFYWTHEIHSRQDVVNSFLCFCSFKPEVPTYNYTTID